MGLCERPVPTHFSTYGTIGRGHLILVEKIVGIWPPNAATHGRTEFLVLQNARPTYAI